MKYLLEFTIGAALLGLILVVFTAAVINISKEQQFKENRVLEKSVGKTIKSYTIDGNTLTIRFEDGGGFSVRGHKGLTIE